MKRLFLFVLGGFCAALVSLDVMADTLVPRTIIALYDSRGDGIPTSYLHTMAEMPLNHLGLNVEYHEIHEPLPDIAKRDDVRGVITWFFSDTKMEADTYLPWMLNAMDSGKKFVVFGALGIAPDPHSVRLRNKVMARIGVKMLDGWVENPFDATYDYKTPDMFATAQPFNWTRPSYPMMQAVGDKSEVHLSAVEANPTPTESDLIVTSPGGGYISANYIFRSNERAGEEINQWLINPFAFFRLAFATDDLPKPDTTTIAGRRIYYSHIDGDGWNNVTRLEEYRDKQVLSSQVIMDKVVKPYPDLPVTVTIIAGDIDPEWAAVKDSRRIAEEFFRLPQVEAGSHTYSHPFHWQFFEGPDSWKNEASYLHLYTTSTWVPEGNFKIIKPPPPVPVGYAIPRAYAHEPFEVHKEIEGSLKELAPLLPPDKKLELVSWSGNCLPWEEVVHLTRVAGVQNINGGDSRADPEYPGYASLAPIGRPVGKERQIYASTSNENTYTNLWSENFHAHGYLIKTLKNSESPIRLKPLNIYYHFYSGEREASLNALLGNIAYARSQDIAPISASHYTHVAEGFYDTRIIALDNGGWRVENRGGLQTIRFDHATFKAVDFRNSSGVVGQRHQQGSLYVYLDAAVVAPVIALKATDHYFAPDKEPEPYLIESRWLVSGLHRKDNRVDFTVQGYGTGDMRWQVPAAGRYRIRIGNQTLEATASDSGLLTFAIGKDALKPQHVTITALATDTGHV